MPTDTQVKALLKKWKDAKPLTLTKTGVSEELRTIKADDPSTMTSCATFLKKKQADAKFKGQKKPLACLKAIQEQLEQWVSDHSLAMKELAKALKGMKTEMSKWMATAEKWDGASNNIGVFSVGLVPYTRDFNHYKGEYYPDQFKKEFEAAESVMESVQAEANKITNIVKDEKIRESLRAKKFDPKAVVQGLCKSCDTKIKAFDPVIKAFEKAAG